MLMSSKENYFYLVLPNLTKISSALDMCSNVQSGQMYSYTMVCQSVHEIIHQL